MTPQPESILLTKLWLKKKKEKRKSLKVESNMSDGLTSEQGSQLEKKSLIKILLNKTVQTSIYKIEIPMKKIYPRGKNQIIIDI